MTAFANVSEFINRGSGGNSGAPQFLNKFYSGRVAGVAATTPIAGRPLSLWTYDNTRGGGGVAPGAVAVPTNTTNGSMLHADASGGRELWMTFFGAGANIPGRLYAYDRLLHISGLSGTVTTAQTVGGTITRNTGGAGNQIWVEIYGIVGTTATTITATYTNQAGTGSRVTVATTFGGTNFREVTRLIMLPLQAGDTGVQSVQSVTVLATTGTAGNFGVNIVKPISAVTLQAIGAGGDVGMLSKGLPAAKIDTGACIAFALFPQAATVPELWVDTFMCER